MDSEVNDKQESLSKDEQAVSRLIAGLKHIEAPANFERRVIAKIAEGRPPRRGFFAFPSIGFAVPALLVVLIASFFVFKLRQPTQAQPEPVLVIDTITEPSTPPSANSVQTPEPTYVAKEEPGSSKQIDGDKGPVQRSRTNVNSNRAGGSYDEALPNKKQPLPEGLEPDRRPSANGGEVMTPTSIQITDVLEQLGMSVDKKGDWRVTDVRENSAADKSGVKVGDVVIALGDREVKPNTSYNGSGSITSISVRREGKLISLKMVLH